MFSNKCMKKDFHCLGKKIYFRRLPMRVIWIREAAMFGSIFAGLLSLQIVLLFVLTCSSFPSNELSIENSFTDIRDTTNDSQVSTIRQTGGSVSGPVAASLAFVGLNLAFISLLVPFVMTALAIAERRENDGNENTWTKRRVLSRWKPQDGLKFMARAYHDSAGTFPLNYFEHQNKAKHDKKT